PNPERRFLQLVPWNVGYEHGSWFFPDAFRSLFELSGFDVRAVSACYGGEYLGIEAVPAPDSSMTGRTARGTEAPRLAEELNALSQRGRDIVSGWEEHLRKMQRE